MCKFVKDFATRQGLGRLSGARSRLLAELIFCCPSARDSGSCSALSPHRRAIRLSVEVNLKILLPFGHCIPPPDGVWDAGAEQFLLIVEFESFAALLAHYSAGWRSLGRLCGAQQGGAGYGATPPSRPPLHPPRSTP